MRTDTRGRSAHRARVVLVTLPAALALAVPLALGQVRPTHSSAFAERVLAPAGFVATVAPERLDDVQQHLAPALTDARAAYGAGVGEGWELWVDRRSGGLALAEGPGIAWIPGSGNGLDPAAVAGSGPGGQFTAADMEARAREFIAAWQPFFALAPDQLVLDARGTINFGERGQFWQVAFTQRIGGVGVAHSRIVLRVSHGNLVQFGVDHVLPAGSVAPSAAVPALAAAQARLALALYLGGLQSSDVFHEEGTLLWVPRGTGDEVGYSGAIGAGWEAELVYRFRFSRPGEISTWEALVDASTGQVLRLVDANHYDALVKASVYTLTNCEEPVACVPGTATERTVTLPFAALNFVGGLCQGDACYSNAAGAFAYPPGAVAAATSLEGKYFRIADGCGAIAAAGVAPGNIDLGTTPPDPDGTNKDCRPANQESAPGSGPTSGGSGDTHAARATFYHLNLINQKSRVYLPHNDWLRGADGGAGPTLTTTNGPPACNALWSGPTQSLVFLQSTPVLNCNNSGEVPDVFLHEFGHGLDNNDASGNAPELATGEAMGDTFALLQGQHSCIGPGMFLPGTSSWGHLAGYGSGSALCSGIRDLDYTRFCWHGTAAGCTPAADPDAPNGSRSGLAPPPDPPDAGTPARWNHMIQGSPAGVADGRSNFYNCGGPETGTGCAGPLNHGCHCESAIPAQANWDLTKAFIGQVFGGDIYAVPQGPDEVSGWQYMDRLWYLTRDLASSAYSVTGFAPEGTTSGCSAVNWFATYRFIDDDDGHLANGTPHADLIFDAFDLHAIACGEAGDASNQPTSCPPPPPAPLLSSCGSETPIQLEWSASAGTTRYRVLRNTLGCEFGFTPIATLGGDQRYYEDAEVAPGIPYYYSVQPVGVSDSCYGQTSNCVTVTPSTCEAVALDPPTGVTASNPADNEVLVEWEPVAGAGGYKILRRQGDCGGAGEFTAIASVAGTQSSFLDTIDLQGTIPYAYRVMSAETACAACTSEPSACVSIVPQGSCELAPSFAGLERVQSEPNGACQLTLEWSPGSPTCGSALAYRIHRSTQDGFVPTSDNLLATVDGTSFVDLSVASGVRTFYIVRALDAAGNTDNNLERRSAIAGGELAPGAYEDDAGDSGAAKFFAAPTPGNTWTVRPSGTGNPTRQYASTESGFYPNQNCLALDSNDIHLGANPSLEFRTRFVIEENWDGGIIEVATAGGGFENWTKLDTVSYPGLMVGVTEVCGGNPGLQDGQAAFSGSSNGWESFGGSLAAYANQTIRLRFLLGTDDLTGDEGWFIDDLTIDDAFVPGGCLTEVSGPGALHALRVGKRGDGTLDLIFEAIEAATAYSVYAGEIGTWYSHEADACHAATLGDTPGPGQRTLEAYDPPPGDAYFLVNGANASAEGVLGFDSGGEVRPFPAARCGPVP